MSDYYIYMVGAVVLILLVCVLALLGLSIRWKRRYDTTLLTIHNLEELNSELRKNRHDHMNQLQVVYGLMELGEYDEVRRYLDPIFKEYQKTGKALRTSRPAVNALLMAKGNEASSRGIDFFVEVSSQLEGLSIPDWELCRVLSNLIDNAMTALDGKEGGRISLSILQDEKEHIFEVENNGPRIEDAIKDDIFTQGFSTKKESGHGMGLAIVRRTVENYKGSVGLRSDDERTTFTVKVPVNEDGDLLGNKEITDSSEA